MWGLKVREWKRLNRDHKTTFRLDKAESWSPVSRDIRALCTALPGAEIVSAEIQDIHYDRSLMLAPGQFRKRSVAWLRLAKSIGGRLPAGAGAAAIEARRLGADADGRAVLAERAGVLLALRRADDRGLTTAGMDDQGRREAKRVVPVLPV